MFQIDFLKKNIQQYLAKDLSSLPCLALQPLLVNLKDKSLTKGTFGLLIHQQMVGVKQCRSQKLFWHFNDSLVGMAMRMISMDLCKTADAVFQPHWTLSFTFLPITHIKTLEMDWTRFVIVENWNTWQVFKIKSCDMFGWILSITLFLRDYDPITFPIVNIIREKLRNPQHRLLRNLATHEETEFELYL